MRNLDGCTAIAVATGEQPGVEAARVLRQFVAHVSLTNRRGAGGDPAVDSILYGLTTDGE